MGNSVVILGGGVAGLSAAHELAERGFDVSVYERQSIVGGKARSIDVPGSARDGRRPLPGEHGFRFFPSFYKHLPDTMRRIPRPGHTDGVLSHLTPAKRTMLARQHPTSELSVLAHFPRSIADLRLVWKMLADNDMNLPWEDLLFFYRRVLVLLTSCDERRLAEYERVSWWDFIEAERRSAVYAKYFGEVAVRYLVACAPRVASLRTVGNIGLQLTLGHTDPRVNVDRLLDGPTHEVWIDPWRAYLTELGVRFHTDREWVGLELDGARIAAARLRAPDGTMDRVTADLYVSAVPVERLLKIVDPALIEAEPRLGHLGGLHTAWMNGMQFFLRRDVPLTDGHIVFVDAPWALTAISEPQFWPRNDLRDYGAGDVRGLLSVCISDWDAKGDYCGKSARDCSAEELKDEVWREITDHLNDSGEIILSDDDLVSWFIADSIVYDDRGGVENGEPLLVNTVDSWRHRPDAVTRIPNLFLAGDYVRTTTDLATMEAANEAARRAVNGILETTGHSAPPCALWPLEEPAVFAAAKALDRVRFGLGLPHVGYDPVAEGHLPRR